MGPAWAASRVASDDKSAAAPGAKCDDERDDVEPYTACGVPCEAGGYGGGGPLRPGDSHAGVAAPEDAVEVVHAGGPSASTLSSTISPLCESSCVEDTVGSKSVAMNPIPARCERDVEERLTLCVKRQPALL